MRDWLLGTDPKTGLVVGALTTGMLIGAVAMSPGGLFWWRILALAMLAVNIPCMVGNWRRLP
jgi:hypothetical protein